MSVGRCWRVRSAPCITPSATRDWSAVGKPKVHPGEVAAAYRGVLFLDEFPEFDARSLEAPLACGSRWTYGKQVSIRFAAPQAR